MARGDWNKAFETIPEDSWLREWMKCWPAAEAPRSFLLFSAMATLGACLGRRVYFDLDVHRLYPLINLLLIAPSGVGKSTALRNIALKTLVDPLPIGPTKPMVLIGKQTKEALHLDLSKDSHAIIFASELANLFSKEKYNEGLIPYVTDLLDLERARIRTKSGGELIIEDPNCCLFGGSTREWLQDMMPSNSAEGGFLPRFLILKEDYKFQRVADPSRFLSESKQLEVVRLRDKVFNDFSHLLSAADGRYDFADYDASDVYNYWYQTYLPDTGALAPFAARAGAHVLRLALLIAVSRFGTAITVSDIESAIALYGYAQGKLAEVVVPMSPQGKLMDKLINALGAEERSSIQLRRAMRNHCGGQDVDKMLMDLERNKEVVRDGDNYRRIN